MSFNLNTKMGWFRLVALLEGISFLVLLFIAVPLKYGMDLPLAVKYTGMIHGILFIAYIFILMLVRVENNWSTSLTLRSVLASVLPFGTFYADKKWWQNQV